MESFNPKHQFKSRRKPRQTTSDDVGEHSFYKQGRGAANEAQVRGTDGGNQGNQEGEGTNEQGTKVRKHQRDVTGNEEKIDFTPADKLFLLQQTKIKHDTNK